MRFIVLGAGAIGGVIGGRLFEYGHEVVLMARGDHRGERLSKNGLRLESSDAVLTLRIPTVDDPATITYREGDILILGVKTQDTTAALRRLASVAPSTLPIICAQNGVENERIALRWFSNVYGMCVMCPATHLTAGVVQAHSTPITGLLDLGRWPAGVDQVAENIASALRTSTFESETREDITRWKWGKLIMNLSNGVEAICGPAARSGELTARARREAAACLETAGIAYVQDEEDKARRGDLLTRAPIGGQSRGGSSSWQSLARSSGTIETDYLNGEIVLLGRLHGVPTPANELIQTVANQLATNRAAPGSVTEAELLQRLIGK